METSIENLSAAQKKKLLDELQKDQQAAVDKKKADRLAYKQLSNDVVLSSFSKLQTASEYLAKVKNEVLNDFKQVVELKKELYGFDESQQSHSFSTVDVKVTIKLGYRVLARYDDTCKTGEAMIGEYLNTLATNKESAQIVNLVKKLLSRDKEGNLNPARVLELKQFADEIQNEQLTEGIEIIIAAYRPEKTKQFIEVLYKDELNAERNLPLSITTV